MIGGYLTKGIPLEPVNAAAQSWLRLLSAAAAAFPRAPPRPPGKLELPGVEHIVAVASGKGGVGKSSTAVNLAAALAAHLGLKVGLMDADIYGPSVPKLLNLHGKPQIDEGTSLRHFSYPDIQHKNGIFLSQPPYGVCKMMDVCMALPRCIADERMIPLQRFGIKAMSMGFLMEESAAAVWRGPMVMSAMETFISRVRWAPLDVLIIDMPPGTGDIALTVSQRMSLSGAVIVTTPQELALLDARRGVTMFRKVDVPILGIVENMSHFVCGKCGHQEHVFGSGGGERCAQEMQTELLGKIPLVTAIRETSDEGHPIVMSHPKSQAAQAYTSVAEKVWNRIALGHKE